VSSPRVKVPNSPADLALPFKSWRPYQREAIERIIESDSPVFFLDGPAGTGKSLIAVSILRLNELGESFKPGTILTRTKQLQEQYIRDFPNLKSLKGKRNFPCIIAEGVTADMGPCFSFGEDGRPCPEAKHCPYFIQKREALKAPALVTNWDYYLPEVNYVGGLSNREWLICDEGHFAEDRLQHFIELRIRAKQLELIDENLPDFKTFSEWRSWAEFICPKALDHLHKQKDVLKLEYRFADAAPETLEKIELLRQLTGALQKLKSQSEEWLIDKKKFSVVFHPIWVRDESNALFAHANKVVLMSATIISANILSFLLGVQDYDYMKIPSMFDKQRRPIYYQPSARLGITAEPREMRKACEAFDFIASKHKNEKGLVHTTNYTLAEYLMLHSKHKSRFLIHGTRNRQEVFSQFENASEPLILVSPSANFGIDLPHEKLRWQVILKMPFPDLGLEVVQKRLDAYPLWYAYSTVCNIVQAYGRIMRDFDDYGTTYILDEHFGWFFSKNKAMFPTEFREALHFI